MDGRHDTPCGPAVKNCVSGPVRSSARASTPRWPAISVNHLYNLRKSTPTQSYGVTSKRPGRPRSTIGERRKPRPLGQPGYIRIDTCCPSGRSGPIKASTQQRRRRGHLVRRGSVRSRKSASVTSFPPWNSCSTPSPSRCSAFIPTTARNTSNRTVAALLENCGSSYQVAFAAVQRQCPGGSKNGAVVRKLFGYSHIPQRFAPLINDFNQQYLNPYIQFPTALFLPRDPHGRPKANNQGLSRYETMMTPMTAQITAQGRRLFETRRPI